jgi:PPK2 family polyphosphate:nucleotide phosphotransferase
MGWAHKVSKKYRVESGKGFRLKDFDPADTGKIASEDEAKELLAEGIQSMSDLQEKLYAQDRWGLLLMFQAMDAAGKDGAIKHVMSGINPQGCEVTSFKTPSSEELNHDYLWRSMCKIPERGRIGIFNRSYYEEVLVVRVHPDVLKAERIPPALVTKNIWDERFDDIRRYERYLTRNGLVICKFFLHLSKKEQKKRFLARLDHPDKNWKFSAADVKERGYWDEYQSAYEDLIKETATEYAPWYVVPADNKWFTRVVVAGAIVNALEGLQLSYPTLSVAQKKGMAEARRKLVRE